jgi:hypothetical protein
MCGADESLLPRFSTGSVKSACIGWGLTLRSRRSWSCCETMTKRIEPTPEDYERVQRSIENARENMLETLARHEARRRVEAERRERRRRALRRLLPFAR